MTYIVEFLTLTGLLVAVYALLVVGCAAMDRCVL